MTSDFPDEALHFRGKTLTPESPRPLHCYSDQSNIPVLENQTDPVFNDTSTHQDELDTSREEQSNVASAVEDPVHLTKQLFSRTVELFRESGNNTMGTLDAGDHHGLTQEQQEEHNPNATKKCASSIDDDEEDGRSEPVTGADTSPLPSEIKTSSDQSLTSHNLPPQQPDHNYQQLAVESQASTSPSLGPAPTKAPSTNHNNDGEVNFQNLLDNLGQPAATDTSAPAISAPTITASTNDLNPALPAETSTQLPPRPPPQDNSSVHPNHYQTDDIRSFHPVQPQSATGTTHHTQDSFHSPSAASPGAATNGVGGDQPASSAHALGGHQQQAQSPNGPKTGAIHTESQQGVAAKTNLGRDGEAPWNAEVQKKYDSFLQEERVYVTEGLWDRFPHGSRLFVGNLPTERVTKRDLFHLFHKYGKLAQISIKQAYGFIQFVESASCRAALDTEQGGTVRGRKIHLEISKPQRNTRNAPPSEPHRPHVGRSVSKSPEYARTKDVPRGRRPSPDRFDRPHDSGRPGASDPRGKERRRRDRSDSRPARSPPPRVYRRDEYRSRDRSIERYDRRDRRRSRSPYGRARRYSSSSRERPRDRKYADHMDLPIPKRSPQLVPDIQIIVIEEVDRQFIFHLENAFRARGLRSDSLILSERISLSAVTERQIVEGVLAISRISRACQYSGRIPLQVFDRSAGANNVRFNEYSELEINVAADVVLHARHTQPMRPSLQASPPQPLVGPVSPQPLQTSFLPQPGSNSFANMIQTLDGPGLQALLTTLQKQQQQQQQAVSAAPPAVPQQYAQVNRNQATDLSSLLGGANRGNRPNADPIASMSNVPNATKPTRQDSGNPMANTSFAMDPNMASFLAKGLGNQSQGQQGQQGQPNQQVQDIISQLAKWRQ